MFNPFPSCVLPQSLCIEEILLDLVCIMLFFLQDIIDRRCVAANRRGEQTEEKHAVKQQQQAHKIYVSVTDHEPWK